jgi:hypothetical protein
MKAERYTRTLDELVTDLLVATLFETDRPPRGVTGLVDWRLNGFISRLILRGAVAGVRDEVVLLPLNRRLPARRLLLVGLGRFEEFSLMQARHAALKIGRAIRGIAAIDVAMHIPAAPDEPAAGDTERAVMDVLRQAQLPDGLLIRWLSPPAADALPVMPELPVGSGHEARR